MCLVHKTGAQACGDAFTRNSRVYSRNACQAHMPSIVVSPLRTPVAAAKKNEGTASPVDTTSNSTTVSSSARQTTLWMTRGASTTQVTLANSPNADGQSAGDLKTTDDTQSTTHSSTSVSFLTSSSTPEASTRPATQVAPPTSSRGTSSLRFFQAVAGNKTIFSSMRLPISPKPCDGAALGMMAFHDNALLQGTQPQGSSADVFWGGAGHLLRMDANDIIKVAHGVDEMVSCVKFLPQQHTILLYAAKQPQQQTCMQISSTLAGAFASRTYMLSVDGLSRPITTARYAAFECKPTAQGNATALSAASGDETAAEGRVTSPTRSNDASVTLPLKTATTMQPPYGNNTVIPSAAAQSERAVTDTQILAIFLFALTAVLLLGFVRVARSRCGASTKRRYQLNLDSHVHNPNVQVHPHNVGDRARTRSPCRKNRRACRLAFPPADKHAARSVLTIMLAESTPTIRPVLRFVELAACPQCLSRVTTHVRLICDWRGCFRVVADAPGPTDLWLHESQAGIGDRR